MVSVGGCWGWAVLPGAGHVRLWDKSDRINVCALSVDRAGMIPDLMLAIASVAVLLSPFLLDAGRNYEYRKREEGKEPFWND